MKRKKDVCRKHGDKNMCPIFAGDSDIPAGYICLDCLMEKPAK